MFDEDKSFFYKMFIMEKFAKNKQDYIQKYARNTSIHTSNVNGDMNENESENFGLGERLYKILIPRLRNGSEKSITCSRCELIVKAATARSAFFKFY